MTKTVAMGMKRYKYHLNLHSIYILLAPTGDLPDDDDFESLPASYRMYAAGNDFDRKRHLAEKKTIEKPN